MRTPICPECDFLPDTEKEYWVKLLISHIKEAHNWETQDAEDYVEGRPYSPDR